MLTECVINVSEGRDADVIGIIAESAGANLLDLHSDRDHNRSVLSLGGELADIEDAARLTVAAAVEHIDLRMHAGVHPRMGAADVVPFIPLGPDGNMDLMIEARNRLAGWVGSSLDVPCFLYGPERPLPEVRREAFLTLDPDTGPPVSHATAGATAVGARPLLVAYNIAISVSEGSDIDAEAALSMARAVASSIRSPAVRSLGLATRSGAQVSCNLVDPSSTGMVELYDAIVHLVDVAGGVVESAELVGLIPEEILTHVPRHRWAELDLSEDRTIEARLESAGIANTGTIHERGR
ncbi:MAG: hypothetical protein ACYCV7_07065 [Acidimicrobiales bacterium]